MLGLKKDKMQREIRTHQFALSSIARVHCYIQGVSFCPYQSRMRASTQGSGVIGRNTRLSGYHLPYYGKATEYMYLSKV